MTLRLDLTDEGRESLRYLTDTMGLSAAAVVNVALMRMAHVMAHEEARNALRTPDVAPGRDNSPRLAPTDTQPDEHARSTQ